MSKISTYLSETKDELQHVTWPTRSQTINFTLIIAAVSIIVAAYLGLFDYLFSTVLKMFV